MGFFDRIKRIFDRSGNQNGDEEISGQITGSTLLHPCPELTGEEQDELKLLCGFVLKYNESPSKETEEFFTAMMEHILADGKISEAERNAILSLAQQLGPNRPGMQSLVRKIRGTCGD